MPSQFALRYIASCLYCLAIGWAALPAQGYAQRATAPEKKPTLACPDATKRTNALYGNLKKTAKTSIMFGHQDDLAYGVGWRWPAGLSDVKQASGDYPAVYGWDLGHLGQPQNLDGVPFGLIRQWIKAVYKRGGINTMSWHMKNPATSGSAWDTTRVVAAILPGGQHHQAYKSKLDTLAMFLKSLKVGLWGQRIPIILRLFHEHNGDWFWWGRGHCLEQEYVALWRFTFDYLVRQKRLCHLIFAFSPDRSGLDEAPSAASYFYGYPGDGYVDLLGLDNYQDVGKPDTDSAMVAQQARFGNSLALVGKLAHEKGKVAALTETGQEKIPAQNWFTQYLLQPIKATPGAENIAYLLVWRNAHEGHHYAPYPGHPSTQDFITFKRDPTVLFESDLPNMYKR